VSALRLRLTLGNILGVELYPSLLMHQIAINSRQ
jgi:hypothetical protein